MIFFFYVLLFLLMESEIVKKRKSIRWNTLRITALGFLSVIFSGGILLYLPVSNAKPIAFRSEERRVGKEC